MSTRRAQALPAASVEPALFELRNYQTRHGRRDELIAMFESAFLDAYDAVIATFRNIDDPNRWVWIRAFAASVIFVGEHPWINRDEPSSIPAPPPAPRRYCRRA